MELGGVVFRAREELWFIAATVAQKVVPVPAVGPVPGGPPALRGVALVDGDMIAILQAGSNPSEAMLVCTVAGEQVGLVGVEIVATGKFRPTADGGVAFEGQTARAFDLASLIAKVRESRWGVTLPE